MPSLAIDRPVAFLDSGIGGIPYLVKLRNKLPRENYLYLADHARFPYGTRDEQEVKEAVLASVDALWNFSPPKMLVLACNTATVLALDILRSHVDVPVVGVVPAVKPAARQSGKQTIGVLATERTINAPYLDRLIKEFADSCRIVREAGGDIVSFVENSLLQSSREEQNRFLIPALKRFEEAGADTLVLGCTHFTYFEENIRSLTGGSLKSVDSREGVANQAVRVLEKDNLLRREGKGSSLFYTTRERKDNYYEKIGESFFLDYRGGLS